MIKYPYMPPDDKASITYTDFNEFMQSAFEYARDNSHDVTMPTGSVIVLDGKIIGKGANGSDYHKANGCERVKRGIPTGQGYELCEGCHPHNHSEPRAIVDALESNHKLDGATLYLWGHWWCCEPCWNAMINVGINQAVLLKGSEVLFNKEAEGNIVGSQLTYNYK